MLLGIIWTVFLVNGRTFIILWMGEASRDGYVFAALLMLVNTFSTCQTIGSQILWAINKHKTQAILQICAAALNIVLSIVLIRWNPLYGATLGTFLSLLIGDIIVMGIVFHKDICLLLALAAGLLSKHFLVQNSILHFVINCTVMCVVYGICMLWFGMNKQEKDMFRSIIRKRNVKLVNR